MAKAWERAFLLTPNAKLMTVDVKPGVPLDTATPKLLFQTSIEGNPILRQYAVTADGQKFLVMETARAGSGNEQFHIELNWFADLETKGVGVQ